MRILLLLTLFITFNSNASDNPEEKAVLAAHAKYYAARTDRDFATMVSMESSTGVYETYSDGSFHKPGRTWSLEDYESNFPVGRLSISYPVLWNGLKKIAAQYSADEQDAMFYGTAAKVDKV